MAKVNSTSQAVARIVVGGIVVVVSTKFLIAGGTVISEGLLYGMTQAAKAMNDAVRNG